MAIVRSARRASVPPRDTDATPFAAILSDLLERIPGAFAAALVDVLGETVDYTGRVDPFDIKLAAAHWHIVLCQIMELSWLGAPRTLVIRAEKKSFILHAVSAEYAVVVLLRRRAGFAPSARALAICDRALAAEAGWALRPGTPQWHPVIVQCGDRSRRPERIALQGARTALPLEVLGSVMGLATRERGFRVRLETGAELTLVREAGGFWYADDTFSPSSGRKPSRAPPRSTRSRPPPKAGRS